MDDLSTESHAKTKSNHGYSGKKRDAVAQRFRAALDDGEHKLECCRAQLSAEDQKVAVALLRSAEAAADSGPYYAWDRLQAFDRLIVAGLTEDERRVRARICAEEAAEKLRNWRGKAALAVLPAASVEESSRELSDASHASSSSAMSPAPSVVQVRALMELLHQSSQNQQHKIELIRRQMRVVLYLLLAAIAAIVTLQIFSGDDAVTVLMPVAFGVLGALLSMLLGLRKVGNGRRIPELRSALEINVMRPAIGAGSALIVALMVRSGVLKLGTNEQATLLLFSFIAGLSERWFRDKVETLAQDN